MFTFVYRGALAVKGKIFILYPSDERDGNERALLYSPES